MILLTVDLSAGSLNSTQVSPNATSELKILEVKICTLFETFSLICLVIYYLLSIYRIM